VAHEPKSWSTTAVHGIVLDQACATLFTSGPPLTFGKLSRAGIIFLLDKTLIILLLKKLVQVKWSLIRHRVAYNYMDMIIINAILDVDC